VEIIPNRAKVLSPAPRGEETRAEKPYRQKKKKGVPLKQDARIKPKT